MKRIPLSLFTFLFLLSGLCAAPTKTVWQIGEKNHSASELALSPDKYKEFLANDFGWEDRFYIIGLSSPHVGMGAYGSASEIKFWGKKVSLLQ